MAFVREFFILLTDLWYGICKTVQSIPDILLSKGCQEFNARPS